MAQGWNYQIHNCPEDSSPLVQYVFGVDILPGFHAIILRTQTTESHVLETLGLPANASAGAYVQTALHKSGFLPFNQAKQKMFMPLEIYLDMLNFFSSEYSSLREKMMQNVGFMVQLDQPVTMGSHTGFYHHGICTTKVSLCQHGNETGTLKFLLQSRHSNQTDLKCFYENTAGYQLALSPNLMEEFSVMALPELNPWLNVNVSSAANVYEPVTQPQPPMTQTVPVYSPVSPAAPLFQIDMIEPVTLAFETKNSKNRSSKTPKPAKKKSLFSSSSSSCSEDE
jgi:hypothetical protein